MPEPPKSCQKSPAISHFSLSRAPVVMRITPAYKRFASRDNLNRSFSNFCSTIWKEVATAVWKYLFGVDVKNVSVGESGTSKDALPGHQRRRRVDWTKVFNRWDNLTQSQLQQCCCHRHFAMILLWWKERKGSVCWLATTEWEMKRSHSPSLLLSTRLLKLPLLQVGVAILGRPLS